MKITNNTKMDINLANSSASARTFNPELFLDLENYDLWIILIFFIVGILVFLVCFCCVRKTRVCQTVRYMRTSDPENVVLWWCNGDF